MSKFLNGVSVLSVVMAIANAGAALNEIQYLSGTDKDHTLPWEFRVSAGRNSGVWTNIPVPSCWETMNFGTYEYGNISTTEYGQYRRSFQVPSAWSGKRVFLVFEGSMTDTETTINGIAPGVSAGGGSSSPLPNDRAFDNSAATAGGSGGIARTTSTGNINLGTRSQFTLTGWIKSAATLASGFQRLMLIGSTNYDATAGQTGAYLSIYNSGSTTNALQFKINGDTGNGALSSPNVLSGTDWIFVAVTYDATLPSSNVNLYVGNKTLGLGAPVSTVSYPSNSVNFGTSAFAYFLNRNTNNRNRAFDGWGDDFRIYNGVLDPATLDAVRASAVDSGNPSPTSGLLYQWSFNTATSGTTVAPDAGSGGGLTLYNGGNSATDLHTSIGGGVSGNLGSLFALHQGGFYEFKYEVTSNLVFGASVTNLLEVTVRKVSADASVNDAERTADYWVFGGIYRPVYLEAKPHANIERLAVDAKADGQITVSTFLSGITNNYTVAARVTDSNNAALGGEFSAAVSADAANVILSASLPPPNPWSAEFPNLYTLTVELREGATAMHTVTNLIGFRTVTFTNGAGFFVNGRKILMRGINRHEFWPTTGRATSREISIADIQLMKDANMNAVRMSHYPPARHFLDECDRLGLYVLDELAGWQGDYDTGIGAALVREMVIRDVNHPCIFSWANGNEGGANPNLDGNGGSTTNYYGLYDIQNRLVIRPFNGNLVFNGVATDHYENYSGVTNYLRPGATTVFMPTEEMHGLYDGGGGACLAEIWDAFHAATNGGGVFLWALIDEGLTNLQTGAIDVKGQSAPDGIVGPFREKEASYYTVKALWSPVQVTAPNPATFAGSLAVENRFDFTGLNQCAFNWQLGWFPDAADPTSSFSTNALTGGLLAGASSGVFAGPSLPPGATGSLALPSFPAGWTNYDALRLTATDPSGNNIYTWTWPLRTPAQIRDRILGAASANSPAIAAGTDASEIIVTNGPRIFRFSKTSGVINSLTVSNQPVSFTNGPRPVAGSAWAVTSVTNYSDGTNYVIAMNDPNSSANAFQWSLRPDGWVKLTYRYSLTGLQENIGITFDYPGNHVTALNWLGQGPNRVWKNRTAGQEVFTHRKTINNTWTGQVSGYSGWTGTQWTYPEFAGFHGQLYWATVQTTEQPITITTPTADIYFRVLSPPATDQPNVNPTFPPGAISLLQGISAIGDKFTVAYNLGPSAATNVATGIYTGEANFFFGPVPASGADRDGNGLTDAWEFNCFGAIGQNPNADCSGDGLPLMLENAFDLSPFVSNTASARLPHLAAGRFSPAALAYSMPPAQLDYFSFVPGLSADLMQWFWADAFPGYFLTRSASVNGETAFSVEPNLTNWPASTNQLFLWMRIGKRN